MKLLHFASYPTRIFLFCWTLSNVSDSKLEFQFILKHHIILSYLNTLNIEAFMKVVLAWRKCIKRNALNILHLQLTVLEGMEKGSGEISSYMQVTFGLFEIMVKKYM